jgi:two-component system, OmpR family, KDP operon response regulator KdpE
MATYEVTKGDEVVHLTPIEFRLLAALARGHGKVLTHRQLLLEVWGAAYVYRPHYLRVYMANLRQKLEDSRSFGTSAGTGTTSPISSKDLLR